jgi:hypothetical protein
MGDKLWIMRTWIAEIVINRFSKCQEERSLIVIKTIIPTKDKYCEYGIFGCAKWQGVFVDLIITMLIYGS